MSEQLSSYLAEVLSRRFAYGDLDCCTFMADWLMQRGLPDPMADRRDTYSTRRAYRTAIRGEGGLVASCRRRFAGVGLRMTMLARPGSVALVRAPIGRRRDGRLVWAPTGAIVVSERWRAVVTPDAGLVMSSPDILVIWTI